MPAEIAPVAVDDAYHTPVDTALTVPGPGVTENDSSPNGAPLTALLDSSPANGKVALQAGGSFTYTPRVGFVGEDHFTYRTSDDRALSNPATVNIQVQRLSSSPGNNTVFLPLIQK